MKGCSILFLFVVLGTMLILFKSCCEYKRTVSVYKYGDVKIYRRDYYGGFEADWIQFSSTKDFNSGWVVEVTSSGGIDGTIEGRFKVSPDSVVFYCLAGYMKLLNTNTNGVYLEQDRKLTICKFKNHNWLQSVLVYKDSCLVEFLPSLKAAQEKYLEWLSLNQEFKDDFKFEILDTSNVIVHPFGSL